MTPLHGVQVSAESLRQPLFFSGQSRNEILVTCTALVNEYSKQAHAEALREQAILDAEEEASMTTARTGATHDPGQGQGDEALKGMYEVLFDYLPEDARLLKVEAGQRITVVGRREDWLLAIDQKGHMGFVPPSYVQNEVEADDY